MSKFKECKSIISHHKDNKACITLPTSLYIFSEAQSTGDPDYYEYSKWEWDNKIITIQEVGIHPNKE